MLLLVSSCAMKEPEGSRITITFPSVSKLNGSSKISTLSYDWSNACFAVNVTGSGVPGTRGSSCSLEHGAFKGTVAAGGSVELTVPRGQGRKLEVFAYFRMNSTVPCPEVSSLSTFDPSKTVRVGQVDSFDVVAEVTNVTVNVSAPNASDNLLTQYGLAATCSDRLNVPATGSAGLAAGHAVQTGGGLAIRGAITGKPTEQVLTGGQLVMKLTRSPNEE